MAERIEPKANRPLGQAEAVAGAEVSATDVARARAKWRRRVADFEARIRAAALTPSQALTPSPSPKGRGGQEGGR